MKWLDYLFYIPVILIGGLMALCILIAVWVSIAVRFSKKDPAKRRLALAAFAAQNSLAYAPDDPVCLVDRIKQVEPFRHYLTHKVANVMRGPAGGRDIVLFDFEVGSASESGSVRGKFTYREVIYYHSACMHDPNLSCPDLIIRPRHVGDELVKVFGYDDIAFESDEFSRAFRVKGSDKKFAYDICNPRMMELLLAERRWHVQITGGAFILLTGRESKPDELRAAMGFLAKFLDLVPEFVYKQYAPQSTDAS